MKAVCNHFESGRGICEIFALPLSKLTLCCSSQHYRHTKHRSCCCCHINNSHVMRISQLDVGQWMVEVDNNRRDRDLIWLSVSFRARRRRTQKRSIVRLRDKTRNNRAALINGGRQAVAARSGGAEAAVVCHSLQTHLIIMGNCVGFWVKALALLLLLLLRT